MLKVIRRSTDPYYKSKGVLLTVNHTLDRNDLVEILQTFCGEFGNQALRDVLVDAGLLNEMFPYDKSEKPCHPFFALVGGPTHGHSTMKDAVDEAKQLALKEKKIVCIARQLSLIEPVCGPVTLKIHDL